MTVEEILKKKKEELKNLEIEIQTIEHLKESFSDLEIRTSRRGVIMYCSKSVNSLVTEYELHYSCGCCNDAHVEIYPFLIINGVQLYSSPCYFVIGQRNSCYGYKLCDCDEDDDCNCPIDEDEIIVDNNWDKRLKEANISEQVINELKDENY